ncbi:MAG: SDR family oxidoreductase [Planctomycetaceae bacterium]|nr:SDR family oxidoreductase [Planctomycetaceae bacterium]
MNNQVDSRHRSSKRYTLLTGATGLVGRYLMRDLLLKGHKLAVIVRPTKQQMVRERIEGILQMWEGTLGHRLPRPVLLTGDVTKTNLGLSSKQLSWSEKFLDQIIHGAAVLKFQSASRELEPWKTNLGGTQNVLDFSKRCNIRDFHYISTAYVCGQREATVYENELDVNQTFRNDYEVSKFEAEQLVRESDCFESTTIYRPAVISGDSQTGYTSTYHGLFLYLRLMAMLVPEQTKNADGVIETPISLPIEGDEPRNVVPVDWVAKTICHLVRTPEAHGRTYHLVPDQCTSAREVIEYCYKYFHSDGVKFCGADSERTADSELAEKLFENTSIYESYETSDPHFDKRNVSRFAGHLECPSIDQEMIFKLIDFGKQNRWGKEKENAPKVVRWIESHLTEIALAAQKMMGALRISGTDRIFKFGLDIHGPGGGQWQLLANEGRFDVTPGLPDDSSPVLKLSDIQINDLLMRHDSEEIDRSRTEDPKVAINWTGPLETVITENPQPNQ